ncbi:unnamed protein product [Protopolystoma xenopodis]|uniref:RING-CH-type domain-containing protein n=1 Tax=Protopolystoma xenopodis TaxID=117903 RepID=A0A3S5CPD3_9PLAT|nr:unnamed protein product [Protopolystoma xenopodis]
MHTCALFSTGTHAHRRTLSSRVTASNETSTRDCAARACEAASYDNPRLDLGCSNPAGLCQPPLGFETASDRAPRLGSSDDDMLIAPCLCDGTLKYVHERCLQKWIAASDLRVCEICQFPFVMRISPRPLLRCVGAVLVDHHFWLA